MGILILFIIAGTALAILGLAATLWGTDSRECIDPRPIGLS